MTRASPEIPSKIVVEDKVILELKSESREWSFGVLNRVSTTEDTENTEEREGKRGMDEETFLCSPCPLW